MADERNVRMLRPLISNARVSGGRGMMMDELVRLRDTYACHINAARAMCGSPQPVLVSNFDELDRMLSTLCYLSDKIQGNPIAFPPRWPASRVAQFTPSGWSNFTVSYCKPVLARGAHARLKNIKGLNFEVNEAGAISRLSTPHNPFHIVRDWFTRST